MPAESEELNLIIRLIMPDAKVQLDTKEAEAAVDRLREKVRQIKLEAGGALPLGGPGTTAPPTPPAFTPGPATPPTPPPQPGGFRGYGTGSGYSVTTQPPPLGAEFWAGLYAQAGMTPPGMAPGMAAAPAAPAFNPGPSLPPARSPGVDMFGLPMAGYARTAGPYVNPLGYSQRPGATGGSWAYGPVSDGGSFAASSLQTARGYDVAMLREHVEGLNSQQYEGSLQRLQQGLMKTREAALGLSASIVLLNKAMESGSGWDNWYTMGTAGLGLAAFGGRLVGGAADVVRGGAGIGAGLLNAGAAAAGAGSLGRGLAWGGRALGGLAGVSSFAIGAPIATAVALGGAYAYYRNQGNQADAAGLDLDQEMRALQRAYQTRQILDPFSSLLGSYASTGLGNDLMSSYGGWTGLQTRAENSRLINGLGWRASQLGGIAESARQGGNFGLAAGAEEQRLAALDQIGQRIQSNIQATQREAQAREQVLRTTQRQLEVERDRGRAAAGQVGRMDAEQLGRLGALGRLAQARGGLDYNLSRRIERVTGIQDGSSVDEFFINRGLGGIDNAPDLRPYLSRDARTSEQMRALDKQISETQAALQSNVTATQSLMSSFADAFSELSRQIQQVQQQVAQDRLGFQLTNPTR